MSRLLRRNVVRIGRGLLATFLGSIMALCGLMMVLPSEASVSRSGRRRHSIFPEWMFEYRTQMMREIEENSKTDATDYLISLLAITVKYSVLLPVIYWKECLLGIVISSAYPWMRSALYTYTPDWVDELSTKMVKKFSTDDLDPPPGLEVDESVRSTRHLYPDGLKLQLEKGAGGSSRSLYSTPSSSGSRIRQYNGTEIDADDWYVFDPTYGVIPISCRDLWNKQAREMEIRRQAAMSNNRDKKLLPVRFRTSAAPAWP